MNPSLPARAPAAPPREPRPEVLVVQDPAADLTWLKRLLWLYFALWIMEGALRKWIVPGLATPLLVIRDPILLLMYYVAFTKGLFPKGVFVSCVVVLGAIAMVASIAATETPLVIEVYGLRASYLHLLLIFLIPKIFDVGDVRRVGQWTLLAAGPMAALVFLQFLAGRNSWLNAGAGGATGAMIESAFGHIRPSGTFSFTNGLTGFTALTAVFFLYHLLEKRVYPRLIWLAAAPALVVLIVLSGSRSAAGLVCVIMGAVAFISVVHARYRAVAFRLAALLGVLIVVGGTFAVFKQGIEVFAYRFGNAANVRTGFIGRFFDSFNVPFILAEQAETFGAGLGMGTNVAGGVLLGHSAILLAEGEMGRNILESGPLIGGLYIGLRACMVLYIGQVALRSLMRDVNPLPLLLFSGCFIDLLQGQFSQPTELGFTTIACGFCLAATRPAVAAPWPERVQPAGPPPPPSRRVKVAQPAAPAAPEIPKPAGQRGRSVYADRLHERVGTRNVERGTTEQDQ